MTARPIRYSRSNPKPIPHELIHLWGERFTSCFRMCGETECWDWTGHMSTSGYGLFEFADEFFPAHRISFEVYKGRLERGMEPDHTCRNRRCVNPAHLEAVSFRENLRRGLPYRKNGGKKLECKRGHSLTGENVAPNGVNRVCRTCRDARTHRRRVVASGSAR